MSNQDVKTWTFAGLQRGEDGKFNDGDLARILMDATAHHAGAFKARGTPRIMRTVEIMTISMARKWGACTLNEFRKSLGLKRELSCPNQVHILNMPCFQHTQASRNGTPTQLFGYVSQATMICRAEIFVPGTCPGPLRTSRSPRIVRWLTGRGDQAPRSRCWPMVSFFCHSNHFHVDICQSPGYTISRAILAGRRLSRMHRCVR